MGKGGAFIDDVVRSVSCFIGRWVAAEGASCVISFFVVSLDSKLGGNRAIRRFWSNLARCIGQSVRHVFFLESLGVYYNYGFG